MKLKKINKHGDYIVKISQVECNLLQELLGYISYKDIKKFPNLDVAMEGMINFTQDFATLPDSYDTFKFVKDDIFEDHGSLEAVKDLLNP
jgi:hypothetical protein